LEIDVKMIVENYLESKNSLFSYFDCNEEYFVKPVLDYEWRIKEIDNMFILTYWKQGGKLNECIIAKKDNIPIIVRKSDYSLVVAIECVKVAIILKTEREV